MRWLLVTLLVLCASARASAQDAGTVPGDATAEVAPAELIGRARRAIDDADFLVADQALDRLAQLPLAYEDLIVLYELRALLAYADEREGALEEALLALASLAPERPYAELPSSMRARLEALRAAGPAIRLGVELVLVPTPPGSPRRAAAVPSILEDPARVVRTTRVRARLGAGPYTVLGTGETLTLPDPSRDAVVDVIVEAYALGQVRVFALGSESDPERHTIPRVPPDDTALHVGLVTLVAFLVSAAVATAVAAEVTDGFTQGLPTRLEIR